MPPGLLAGVSNMNGKTRRQRDSGATGSQVTTGNGSIEKSKPVLQPSPNVKENDENIFLFWPNIIGMDILLCDVSMVTL